MPTKRITTKSPTRPSGKPFVPYGRISKLNGRTKGDNVSIEEQEREIKRVAHVYKLKLLPELVSDEDVTGATFDRPGWEKAISLVQSGKAAGIVAFDLKRISRGKTAEVLLMVEDVEAVGGQIYDSNGIVSVEDADAELITTVKAMIARREWREKRSYLTGSVRNAIERGVHLSAPFGYRKRERQQGEKSTKLLVQPEEAAQVRRAFELRAGGHTWPAIAQALNESGTKPRPYKRDGQVRQAVWTHKTVRQIVGNEVYLGVAYNGDHRHPGAHEAIVTPELYARANKTKGTKPVGPPGGYLLTGLVRCSGCGYAMTHAVEGGRRYYRCRAAQHGDGRCPAPASVPAEDVETFVAGRFTDEYLGTSWAADRDDAQVSATLAAVETAKGRLAAAMRLKVELGDEASETELELADEQIAAARASLRQAEQALVEARMSARGAELPTELDADLFAKATRDDVAEARHWLSLVYRCVVVRPARVWREPAADRARIVHVDDAPADSTRLIAFVVGLDR
jgi:DNA invertase Pin-like site-specific DNA recombinase